jgi:hypothetical protein
MRPRVSEISEWLSRGLGVMQTSGYVFSALLGWAW